MPLSTALFAMFMERTHSLVIEITLLRVVSR